MDRRSAGGGPKVGKAACQGQSDHVAQLTAELIDLQRRLEGGEKTAGLGELVRDTARSLSAAKADLSQCLLTNRPAMVPILVDPLRAMQASASIPAFFPPVLMGTDDYVDGGVRAGLPTEAAIVAGASWIIGVQAGPDAPDPATSGWTMIDAAKRSLMDLAINEISHRDANPPAWPSTVRFTGVAPRVNVHSVFVLYPAFIRQRMAYGWMCAADAIHPTPDAKNAPRARDIADRISVLRYGTTRLEAWLEAQPAPPSLIIVPPPLTADERARAVATLQAMKNEIRDLVAERRTIGALVPASGGEWDDPNRWFFGQEVHPWNRGSRDDGTVVGVAGPHSLAVNSAATLSVTVFSGNTVWDPASGYQLSFAGSQGVAGWTVQVPPLPGLVHPGQQARVDVVVTAPSQQGAARFFWTLRRGTPFGGQSDRFDIAVTAPNEPPECDGIRAQIATLDARIADLNDRLTGDPHTDGPIRHQIAVLQTQRAGLVNRGRSLGCTL